MGIIYVGNCGFEPTSEVDIGRDLFGLDTLTRTFEGRTDHLEAFMKTLNGYAPDAEFPQFKARTARSSGGNGVFTRVTAEYVGLWNDELPEAVVEPGWRTHTVQLQKQGGSETCEVEYTAPTTLYRYITRSEPRRRRYRGSLNLLDEAWEILGIRGARDTEFFEAQPVGRIGGVTTGGRTVTGKYNYVREVVSSPVFSPKRAGDYWTVEEENEGRILPIDRTDLPRLLRPRRIVLPTVTA